MKTFTALAFALAALSSPAFADAPPPTSLSLRFVITSGGAPRAFDVLVTSDHRCADISQKRPDHEDTIAVCTGDEGRLDIEWHTRSAAVEYHSKGSVVLVRGGSAELGAQNGPRLTVSLQ